VRQYLLHYGYAGTLHALDGACGGGGGSGSSSSNSSKDGGGAAGTLQLRASLRRHILTGGTEAALGLLQRHRPQLLQGCSEAGFLLSCQRYVELVRGGRLEDAVLYARAHLSTLLLKAPQWEATLRVGGSLGAPLG
jgi:hypothetical protein